MQLSRQIILTIIAVLLSCSLIADDMTDITGAWQGEMKSPKSKIPAKTVIFNFINNNTVIKTSSYHIAQGAWEQVGPSHYKATIMKLVAQDEDDPEHDPDIEQVNFFFILDDNNDRMKGHWTQMNLKDPNKPLIRGQFFGERLHDIPLPYDPPETPTSP